VEQNEKFYPSCKSETDHFGRGKEKKLEGEKSKLQRIEQKSDSKSKNWDFAGKGKNQRG